MGEVAEVQSHCACFYRSIVRQARRQIGFLEDLDQAFGETAMADKDMDLSGCVFLSPDLVDEVLDVPSEDR